MPRKIKNLHINYPAHECRAFPFPFTKLAYCFENGELNDTPHTHVLVELEKPRRKDVIIAVLAREWEL